MSVYNNNDVKDIHALQQLTDSFKATERMPVLFLGHGSPMNAIEDNQFTRGFQSIAKDIPRPKAILCISAHWETRGTYITAVEHPETIHDFGGFPKALYDIQYPAPGSPELAVETQQMIKSASLELTNQWGLDHGCWAVVKFLYPDASIPVVQLSIDHFKGADFHYQLGNELAALRRKGVLIVGSGNTIHNLRMVNWENMNTVGFGYDWAVEANEKMKELILKGDHQSLLQFRKMGKAFDLSIPTPEHFYPLLYTLGLQEKDEKTTLFNDALVGGSLNMMSVKIDRA